MTKLLLIILVNRKHLLTFLHILFIDACVDLCCLFTSLVLFYWLVQSSVLLTLSYTELIYCPWLCPGSTSSVRSMQWRGAASRLPCLRVWEPNWRLKGFIWRRNWTSWAPKSLRLLWSWTQTPSHFLPSQAMCVISGRLSFLPSFFFFFFNLIIICSVTQPVF